MENIHLISTNKPSRLTLSKKGLFLQKHIYQNEISKSFGLKNQHIYITNNEEIKKGNWYIDLFKNEVRKAQLDLFNDKYKKVILTDNKDLIKDGIQAIDEEFLQWYVKNPSCERVEVEHFGTCCGNQSITQCINCKKYNPVYKIIIPQEEPKQETLEEAAYRLSAEKFEPKHIGFMLGVIEGAKWQAERMYSEVEVIQILINYLHYLTTNDGRPSEEWFEQFKKK
jgi:hypothetical protein